MKAKILIVIGLVLIVFSCNKDQFTTKPILTFKSTSADVLYPDHVITFNIEFTDAEGDIQDSIWVQKKTKNCTNSDFTQRYKIPTFTGTKNQKGNFDISFAYGLNLGYPPIKEPQCIGKNDTCVFRFWARDNAKNVSDTITSSTIILVKR